MRRVFRLIPPDSWLRMPRRTARLRLTALYGALFMVLGAALLAITYVLFDRATEDHVVGPSRDGNAEPITAFPIHPAVQGLAKQSARAAQLSSDRHQLLVNSAIALVVVTALAIALGWVVAGRALRPVRAITTTARRISATNLHERLGLNDADEEFKQLADTLDDLFARLERSFEAQRHFVANASHELRTPLTRLRALLEVGLGDPSTSDAWGTTATEAIAATDEQERLIEALLTLATSEGGLDRRELVDLSVVADEILLARSRDLDRLGLHLVADVRPAFVDGDPVLIERLVANLVDNAIRHNIPGGRIEIATATEQACAEIAVANTGPVIPAGDVGRLFEPFQRLNARRVDHTKGHGLGLSIVRAIALAHAADVTVHAPSDGGLSIAVSFALAPNPHPSPQSENLSGTHSHGSMALTPARPHQATERPPYERRLR